VAVRRNKYNARKVKIDGHVFDSIAESQYYAELKLRQRAGDLKILELQPKVYLTRAKILMKLDFLIERDGEKVWIDVKGMPTPVFNLKKRLWKHYGPGKLEVVYKNKIEVVNGI